MRFRSSPLLIIICGVLCRGLSTAEDKTPALPPPAAKDVDFSSKIQPLFKKNCFSCHGAEHQEGGLRLDDKKRALEGGDSGAEIVPGKSADSRLVRVIAGVDEDFGQMPPEGKGTPLTAAEISLIRAWIDQGATWPDSAQLAAAVADHWSFRPVTLPALPAVEEEKWLAEPIDALILVRLEAAKVAHSPPAAQSTLLRRLYLDLVGLLPTPEVVEEFTNDLRPDAVSRLIDRLLASPAFGERWGRHWLDLARYADSDGYEKDRPRPFAYKYRDWVIAAINADMPYDQFTIEQIAGDMLPGATQEQRIAAGLHRNTLHNTEGGTDPEEDRVKKTIDRTNTLGAIWLGLTVGCAQCHTHKYDPITQREYYSLLAFFNSIEEKDLENPTPEQAAALTKAREAHAQRQTKLDAAVKTYVAEKLPQAQADWEQSLANLSADEPTEKNIPADVAAALAKAADQRTADDTVLIAKHYRAIDKELAKLEKAARDHKAKPPQLPEEAKAQSVAQLAQPRTTNVLLRGDFLSPGDAVEPNTLSVLSPLPTRSADVKPDRVDLSHWLVDPANPLPARVAVNRVWHQLFGRGIVPTLDDFGKQGDPPSHPDLLELLASEFVESVPRWSMKRIIRRVVSSSTYQQTSAPRRDLIDRDPENVLVARQMRRRVEAEIIRDLTLTASGLLTTRIAGPSVRPPQPAEYATLTYANSAKWAESKGGDRYRRGMYTFFQRTSPYPMLVTFDSPDSNECQAGRQTSNTPLQALTLWNDPVFFECAQSLGRSIVAEVPQENDPQQTARLRAERAFLLGLSRRPTSAETADVHSLFESARQLAAQDEAAARQMIGEPVPTSTSAPELAGWITVARTLLNLDEFVTRE